MVDIGLEEYVDTLKTQEDKLDKIDEVAQDIDSKIISLRTSLELIRDEIEELHEMILLLFIK